MSLAPDADVLLSLLQGETPLSRELSDLLEHSPDPEATAGAITPLAKGFSDLRFKGSFAPWAASLSLGTEQADLASVIVWADKKTGGNGIAADLIDSLFFLPQDKVKLALDGSTPLLALNIPNLISPYLVLLRDEADKLLEGEAWQQGDYPMGELGSFDSKVSLTLTTHDAARTLKSMLTAFENDYALQTAISQITYLSLLLENGSWMQDSASVAIAKSLKDLIYRMLSEEETDLLELSAYNGIPHLLGPVVVEPQRAAAVLRYVAREMDRRYKVFAKASARNIQVYNRQAIERGESKMPYIVVFIDELADLMMIASEEVEKQVCRIAQLARATGIHLVIATQRPSVDVVTGLIKANFPARLAFAVTSLVDSRVIIDAPGADKLLGRGDSLYMPPDSPKLERVQGCWVSDSEINSLVAFWRAQSNVGVETPALAEAPPVEAVQAQQPPLWPTDEPEEEGGDEDPLLQEAIEIVAHEGKASVSYLQRRLRIGYTRAARLVDAMEDRNIVGPPTGSSKPRDVYVKPKDLTKQY